MIDHILMLMRLEHWDEASEQICLAVRMGEMTQERADDFYRDFPKYW